MADSRIIIPPYMKALIRSAYKHDNTINQSDIARLFGVSRQRIGQIVHDKKYEYLELPTTFPIKYNDIVQAYNSLVQAHKSVKEIKNDW